jgi:hypothetical protein
MVLVLRLGLPKFLLTILLSLTMPVTTLNHKPMTRLRITPAHPRSPTRHNIYHHMHNTMAIMCRRRPILGTQSTKHLIVGPSSRQNRKLVLVILPTKPELIRTPGLYLRKVLRTMRQQPLRSPPNSHLNGNIRPMLRRSTTILRPQTVCINSKLHRIATHFNQIRPGHMCRTRHSRRRLKGI